MPKRVVFKRGVWLPPTTIYVGRRNYTMPKTWGEWGNPFRLKPDATDKDRHEAVIKHRELMLHILERSPNFLEPLRGKDLACWCHLDQECHADTLLELANR